MTETQWRFLKAISDRVPDDGIVELRLFPAIRQGGAESGVAVVAVKELFVIPDPAVADAALTDTVPAATVLGDDQLFSGDGGEQLQLRATEVESIVGAEGAAPLDIGPSTVADVQVHYAAPELTILGDASPGPVSPTHIESAIDVHTNGATAPLQLPAEDAGALSRAPKRYAVLAARYRLTLKGPDRGHWDFEITHEADAPLDTVDRVARGVARRAGDVGEPETFSAFQLRSTLSQPWWNSAT